MNGCDIVWPMPIGRGDVLVGTARERLVDEYVARHVANGVEHVLVGNSLVAQAGHEALARAHRRHFRILRTRRSRQLDLREPAFGRIQCLMPCEIHVQGSHRNATGAHRIEVGSGTRILLGSGRSDPVDWLSARIGQCARPAPRDAGDRAGWRGTPRAPRTRRPGRSRFSMTLESSGCSTIRSTRRRATLAAVSKWRQRRDARDTAMAVSPSSRPSIAAATVPE